MQRGRIVGVLSLIGVESFPAFFYFIFSCFGATFDEDVVVPLTLSRLIPCVDRKGAK